MVRFKDIDDGFDWSPPNFFSMKCWPILAIETRTMYHNAADMRAYIILKFAE
jgi:hypothetical protein